MSVIFRPNRSTLEAAMKEAVEFSTLGEMAEHICMIWNNSYAGLDAPGDRLFKDITPRDIVLQYMGNDERNGWRDCMHVCLRRNPYHEFRYPQCVGMCATDYDKPIRSDE